MNRIILRCTALLLLAVGSAPAHAGNFLDDVTLEARVGYSLGATAPLGIPATIRELNSYKPTASIQLGIDALKPLGGAWGVMTGLHVENKGMDAAITTKGYYMAMVKGGEALEGVYTGRVEQQVKEWMLTLPVLGTFNAGADWQLRVGPYVSLLVKKDFSGNVSNGYLRKDDPTGPKIEMGDAPEERATYDFTDHMRSWQMGLLVGAQWRFAHRWSLVADLSWGLTGVMKSSFHTIEQTLYPIYGTIAFTYQIK